MHLEQSGLIFDAARQPVSRRAASFVGLCPLSSGRFLCCFQVGPRKNDPTATLGLCCSGDRGQAWQEVPLGLETTLDGVPGSLAAGEIVEVAPNKLLLFATWFDRSDPKRPLFDPVTEGILPSRQLLAESPDGGRSWSAWRELPTPGLRGCSLTGPVLRWPDGTIGMAFESYKEYDDPQPGHHGAWLMVSRDAGRTFAPPRLVARHPEHSVYYWDQRLALGPGRDEFVATFWTHDLRKKQDLAVHFCRGSLGDAGPGRVPIRATAIPGQIAAPLVLPDGRILAFVVDRGRPATMTLWQSPDGGTSWPREDALVVYTHDDRAALRQASGEIDFKQYWEEMGKWTFGHPAIRPLGPDHVLLAWYAGPPDSMSVHWARVCTG